MRTALLLTGCLGGCLWGPLAGSARADRLGRVTVVEENDSLVAYQDRHYTQGLLLFYLSPELEPGDALAPLFAPFAVAEALEGGSADVRRRFALGAGQSIFTPVAFALPVPNASDRPFAAWLYGSLRLLEERDGRLLQALELQLGVVGPAALGEEIQDAAHLLFGQAPARGWRDQLGDEPGAMLSYDAAWRATLLDEGRWGVDVVPELGGSAGNVLLYGQAGGLLRVGQNLSADYGPTRIRPALSGGGYFDEARVLPGFGAYLFAGGQERLIARNLFLAGNTFGPSARVDEDWSVFDLSAGACLFFGGTVRLDLVYTYRHNEFRTQTAPDTFGNLNVTFAL